MGVFPLFLSFVFIAILTLSYIIAEEAQINKPTGDQNGKKKKKKKKETEDVFSKFLLAAYNSSASYHGKKIKNDWCPDAPLCEQLLQSNASNQTALCAQRWLFILTTLQIDSPVHNNHSVFSILKLLNILKPTIIMDLDHDMSTNAEYLSNQLTFAKRFNYKKQTGAWIQNPIDMKSVFLDLQKLFSLSLLSIEALGSLYRQLSEMHIIAAAVNNFLTKDSLLFLKAVFPCSRIIVHNNNPRTAAISNDFQAVNLSRNIESLVTRLFANTSFIVNNRVKGSGADSSSQYMHTMLNQLIRWLGIDERDCKISRVMCSNSDVGRISTGHCVEGGCEVPIIKTNFPTVEQ